MPLKLYLPLRILLLPNESQPAYNPVGKLDFATTHHLLPMDESFHFALLRILVVQILKALGFDKCKPSVANVITDLCARYLAKLLAQSLKLARHRDAAADAITMESALTIQDVSQAMLDIGLLKPRVGESILDAFDVPPVAVAPALGVNHEGGSDGGTKTAELFKLWLLYSDVATTARKLSRVSNVQVQALVEKRRVDLDEGGEEEDKEKRERRLRERQEYYNQAEPATRGAARGDNDLMAAEAYNGSAATHASLGRHDAHNASLQLDWLNYLAEKDLHSAHDLRFLNTALHANLVELAGIEQLHLREDREKVTAGGSYRFDHMVIEIEEGVQVPEAVVESLPYNVRYDAALLEDDLQAYWEFAQRERSQIEDKSDLREATAGAETKQAALELDEDAVIDK